MRRFGLVGKSLQHSQSQSHFTDKFRREGIADASYALFELLDIDQWSEWISAEEKKPSGPLCGLNITIPYKQSIIQHLSGLTEEASSIGAVNAIRPDGQQGWVGHNTDALGFAQSIRPFLTSKHERALILGDGGAAAAVRFALQNLGLDVAHVTRTPHEGWNTVRYEELSWEAVRFYGLIVQATPVGTYPNLTDVLPFPWKGLTPDHLVIDLIYNPAETAFLRMARAHGATVLNGKDMLQAQAEAAWKWWNTET